MAEVGRSLGRLLGRLRSAWELSAELHARAALVDRPWEEEVLHWCADGRGWRLHGHLVPPADGRRRSTTPEGWCPGRRSTAAPGT